MSTIESLIKYGNDLYEIMDKARARLEEIKGSSPSTVEGQKPAAIKHKQTCINDFIRKIPVKTNSSMEKVISSMEKEIVSALNKDLKAFQEGYDSRLDDCDKHWVDDDSFNETIQSLATKQQDALRNPLLTKLLSGEPTSGGRSKKARIKRKNTRNRINRKRR